MDEAVFNANIKMLRERFGDNPLIPLKDVAAYMDKDMRTLQARKGFPAQKDGRFWVTPLASLAKWLTVMGDAR